MKEKLIILIILLLITTSTVVAVDTSNWGEVTVNNISFMIPEKYLDGKLEKSQYLHGDPFDFRIISLYKWDMVKGIFGISVSSEDMVDIDETNIEGHDAVIVYNEEDIDVFFACKNKIVYINYKSNKITDELKEIIKSTPSQKMSSEKFYNKLKNAERDYYNEIKIENMELDLEESYKNYNDNKHYRYYFYGSNGFGFGEVY